MTARRRFILALSIFILILVTGTFGYVLLEDFTIWEGFYMTIITISTVGYGEVHKLDVGGQVFSVLLIVIGFVAVAFAGRAFIESILERVWDVSFKINIMKTKISKIKNHYIVCGYGRVGNGAVEALIKAKADFIIIDPDHEKCLELQKQNIMFVEGDASHEDVLLEAGIKKAKGLISLLSNDPDNLFLVLTARELNPSLFIISRAEELSSESKILRAGADKVFTPYQSTGKQIANAVLGATGNNDGENNSTMGSNVAPQWILIKKGSGMLGQTIDVVSSEMGRDILGLRRVGRDFIFPDKDIVLKIDDQIMVIDEESDDDNYAKEKEKELKKLVIVDDNPIILHLYSRLFHKFGFHPIIANNGKEGLDIILQERPVAAVIDFMLPELSGIELCAEIKKHPELKNTKLILFTGDEDKETRNTALLSGADEVVIKSSDAQKIIKTVVSILDK